jgi:hypothetical protein
MAASRALPPPCDGYVAGGTKTIRVDPGRDATRHSPLVIASTGTHLSLPNPHRSRVESCAWYYAYHESLAPRCFAGADRFPWLAGAPRRNPPRTEDQAVWALNGIPIWLLGSSLFSAQLAALLGLPFAFASHFARVP